VAGDPSNRSEIMAMPIEEEPEEHDFRDELDEVDATRPGVSDVIDHLRDTLTHDMAMRIIPNRLGVTPANDKEFEELMEVLIADAYNDGYDSWSAFPY
jgi:hypothetical protein